MIVRRIGLTLVLILFASVTVGVILGLDDAARSDLVSRLPSSLSSPTTATPEPTKAPAKATPKPTPSVAAPKPSATPAPRTSSTAPKATPKPAPSKKPTAQPKATAKPRATAKPTATAKPSPKTKSSKKAKSSKYLTGPLKKGSGGTVYLTFDDGPSPYTSQILGILSKTGSTATFFHLGVNEGGFPHADAAIRAQGSKVANHSYNHPDLTTLTASQLKWQLKHGPKAKCFRPPYGATNAAVRKAIAHAGMRQVLWGTDTLDWTKPGVSTLAKSGRLKNVQNGSIVLMHDGGGDRSQTVAALPRVIADLHARGYQVRALPYC